MLDARQHDLLRRLEAFDIDGDDPDFSFRDRLARESGWTRDFARRVVDEYKRFVFLCCEAGHPCTPSEHVDQAWHLHLTYTRSYWTRLCNDVLDRPLHHNPTRGGGAEKTKFDDWYAKTKESYERLFGEPAPEDIWTPHERRFGDDLRWERVNLASHWTIPKRPVLLGAGVLALLAFGAAVVGCSSTPGGPIPEAWRIGLWCAAAIATAGFLFYMYRPIRTADAIQKWQYGIGMGMTGLSLGAFLVLLADRWAIPDIGVPVFHNNLWSIISIVSAFVGFIIWATGNGDDFFGEGGPFSGGGGFLGGCGGGCGGGGCGGGGCGGCGG